jgi:hypothetical protein
MHKIASSDKMKLYSSILSGKPKTGVPQIIAPTTSNGVAGARFKCIIQGG